MTLFDESCNEIIQNKWRVHGATNSQNIVCTEVLSLCHLNIICCLFNNYNQLLFIIDT